jgi:hypothetical protein
MVSPANATRQELIFFKTSGALRGHNSQIMGQTLRSWSLINYNRHHNGIYTGWRARRSYYIIIDSYSNCVLLSVECGSCCFMAH